MKFDLHNMLDMKRALSPVSVADNTAQVTQTLDLQGCFAAELAIITGSLGDAGAEFTVTLYEDDASNMSGETAVADADLIGTEALASFIQSDDDKVFKLGYKGAKRYIRAKIVPTNNATAALLAAVWLTRRDRASSAANPPA